MIGYIQRAKTALFIAIILNCGTAWSGTQDEVPPLDYLSFAQGAIPVAVGGEPLARSNFEHAVSAIDGNEGGFVYTTAIDPGSVVEFVYELPALTTFSRLAVPGVYETPSPSQTFARDVEVQGSSTSATEGFVVLGKTSLSTHAGKGEVTDLVIESRVPVRWLKLVLSNGIDVQREKMFLEFSEIIGNGSQETVPLAEKFGGGWRGRGVAMLMQQDGALVSGCYDGTGDLQGTVTGNILRATGTSRDTGVGSTFIATIGSSGAMQGVRSTNGAPFRLFGGEPTTDIASLRCSEPAAPALGCGSVIHGINFDFDSATIRPDSESVLAALHDGLKNDASTTIMIEGHTSSEGSESYNRELAQRRADAVREDLVRRGLVAERLGASGIGEARPIASNNDESGRSLNRRVEIHCSAQ
ncbi:MAG: OmpA family protein [Gammaproteobacteria bacterium]|nr:OmpA family protein [Gammaproteobacteria bacterium]MBP6051090.1 OmpA family protein [Pseudomonadales bacterium]MBK6584194.1 OmpA family protein [Gammaproteobacteria bacterium]MBK7168555.1 OmpA family protein [Gammaproteobacteria bacterium]MBK7520378.1 OmpA family protein [Gammaproteobacteria bacterium]